MGSWIIGGPFGQVLCKLLAFLGNASILVSIQGLVLIAVDRFGAVVYPLRSPLFSSKLCPVVIFATWIVAMAVLWPFLFAFKVVEYPGKMVCEWRWNESFEESSGVFYFTFCYSAEMTFENLHSGYQDRVSPTMINDRHEVISVVFLFKLAF